MPHEDKVRNNHERKGNQGWRHRLLDVDKWDEVHQAEIQNQSTEHGISKRVEVIEEWSLEEIQKKQYGNVQHRCNQGQSQRNAKV